MKKLYSLIKATMTSDMDIFKIKQNKKNKSSNTFLILMVAFCFMFAIWTNVSALFEKMTPMGLQVYVLSMVVFLTAIMTIIEGIYKAGPLIFNSRDDDLLLSLPISRKMILFIRILKFYLFELLFNSLFMIPLIIAYIRWADKIDANFFLTSFIMILFIPIIPIIISSIIGAITSSIASKFKYKNQVQIIISMVFLLFILFISFNFENIFEYLASNATNINDLISKIYYPAFVYSNLVINFNILELLKFIFINIGLFIIYIFGLSKFYFTINSRLKTITTVKKVKIKNLSIKSNSIIKTLIKKELNTFFNIPVFIINAGFGLVIFIVITILITIKFDSVLVFLTSPDGMNLSKDLIIRNTSLLIFLLISATAYMTSITNSVISLEGKNINILKSLPIKVKTILMSKICAGLCITTPVLLMGSIILFIKFKTNILDMFFLILLTILIPLVSHFIGLIINLKYPKLDFENSTEVVKQSMSSFIAVMIGVILLLITIFIITNIGTLINPTLILFFATLIYIVIDILLYLYIENKGVKYFKNLVI